MMTKVFISPLMLEYRQYITELTSRCIKNRYIAGVKIYTGEDPSLAQVDLLPPPRIETIDLTIYAGQVDDLILLETSSDFGIANLRVTIQDGQGNVFESGDAAPWPDRSGLWDYLTKAAVPSGTPVIVSAVATDLLGAVEVWSEQITIP